MATGIQHKYMLLMDWKKKDIFKYNKVGNAAIRVVRTSKVLKIINPYI